jgi:hypothetical protein
VLYRGFRGAGVGQAPADAEVQVGGVPMMFVQSARAMTFDGESLTLEGLSPSTLFFADRPERIVGQTTNEELLATWSEGEDGFAQNPPSAALSILVEGEPRVTIVEFQEPRLVADAIVYKVRVLEGGPPSRGGATALLIDPSPRGAHPGAPPGPRLRWSPGGRDCHWSWYWDRRFCGW